MSGSGTAVNGDASAPSTSQIATDLGRVIGPLRRAILRSARSAEGLPDLPDAHIQVLRALAERSPQTSGELAAGLNLARPTISNVLRAMTTARLVTRLPGADDMRQAWIAPTDHARDLLERYDRASSVLIDTVLSGLTTAQLTAVADALPVLHEIAIGLAHRTDDVD
ncbi:MarR family winged helix-turn-helix transcriptional regulator [Williamsia sp. Leaf354]|uniref:MarR family winged helix-turn-helix transcriptional regulator n=1 Tax=Williamsia sp. Leaf354 TaxID=1736349 RepID=UPI000A6E5F1A|nr:MarR family winged helix-turn-helix transcriptional regulator [Williamsia sp. Leaf354]